MLTSISSVPGVLGVALFNPDNSCIAHSLAPPYEPILLAEAADRLLEAQNGFEGIGLQQPDFLAAKFELGCAVVVTQNNTRAVVLCNDSTNLAMLRVALRVVALKAQQEPQPAPAAASPAVPAVRPPPPPPPRRDVPQDRPSSISDGSYMEVHSNQTSSRGPSASVGYHAPAQNPMSRSRRDLSMSWSERSTAPAGSVGIKVMQHVLRALKKRVGDRAQQVLENELLELRATPRSLTVAQFADLIRGAARSVEDPEDRQDFIAEALGDHRR